MKNTWNTELACPRCAKRLQRGEISDEEVLRCPACKWTGMLREAPGLDYMPAVSLEKLPCSFNPESTPYNDVPETIEEKVAEPREPHPNKGRKRKKYKKLSYQAIVTMKRLFKQGKGVTELAETFGVHRRTVANHCHSR